MHAEGEHIKEPELPDKNNTEEVELPAARNNITPAFNIEVEESDDDYEEEEEVEVEEGFKTPTPRMSKKKAPAKKAASYGVDDLTTDFSASIIQGFQKEGLSTLQYGGHVDFGDGLSVPYLIGGWGEQIVDPNDEWSSITQKYTIIRLIPSLIERYKQ